MFISMTDERQKREDCTRIAARCAGCFGSHEQHEPLCEVLIRLCAEHLRRTGLHGEAPEQTALYYAEKEGLFSLSSRHWRSLADELKYQDSIHSTPDSKVDSSEV